MSGSVDSFRVRENRYFNYHIFLESYCVLYQEWTYYAFYLPIFIDVRSVGDYGRIVVISRACDRKLKLFQDLSVL